MKNAAAIWLALAWFFTAEFGEGQETFEIKLKKAAKGALTRVELTDTTTETFKLTDNDGQVIQDVAENQVKTWVYDETVLERPDLKKKATALKRTYEKALVKTDDDTSVLPYQGKTIIIEKKKDVYQFRYENGGQIVDKDAVHLDEEFNKDQDDIDLDALLLPDRPVALNKNWTVPMAEFAKKLSKEAKITVDADKAAGAGKLVKVFKKDGRQYGDMIVNFEMPVKVVHSEGGDIICEAGASLKLELKLTSCIDGSLDDGKGSWTTQFDATALYPSQDNPMARIEISVRSLVQGYTVEKLKK